MRNVQTQAEVDEFKDGIVRILSNLTLMQVKQQYLDNKEMFDNHQYSVHDASDGEEAELVNDDNESEENEK